MKSTASDPFGERAPAGFRARLNVLGGAFTVESANAAALRLAVDAFGGMPRHKLEREPRRFHVRLVVTDDRPHWRHAGGPPAANLTAGNGLLCATIDAGNFVVVDPAQSRALVCISRALLRFPYHARYELIELAMVTLASRAQSLVPLHAACFGARGSGLLVMGSSGAGKSTLALHALASGMQMLSEDSAFVAVDNLRVTGVPNFLHVQPSALEFLTEGPLLTEVRRSPMIVRRSGAKKYEVDLRNAPGEIAATPLRLVATVFLSRTKAVKQRALELLGGKAFLPRLRREQPYAAGLPNWRSFERRIATLPAYELRRMEHPASSIEQLRALLATVRRRS